MGGDVSEGKALKCQHCNDTFVLLNNIITKQKFSNATEFHKQNWHCPDCDTHSNVLLNLDDTPAAASQASAPAANPTDASKPPDTTTQSSAAEKMCCVIVTPKKGATASNGAPENNASGNAVPQDNVKPPEPIGTSASAAVKTEPKPSSTPEPATPDTKGGAEPAAPGPEGGSLGSLESLESKRPRIEAPSTSLPGSRRKCRRKVTPNLVVRRPRAPPPQAPALPAIPDVPEEKESPKEEVAQHAMVINWNQSERKVVEAGTEPAKEE